MTRLRKGNRRRRSREIKQGGFYGHSGPLTQRWRDRQAAIERGHIIIVDDPWADADLSEREFEIVRQNFRAVFLQQWPVP